MALTFSVKPTAENREWIDSQIQNKNSFVNQVLTMIRTGQIPLEINNLDGETTVTAKRPAGATDTEIKHQGQLADINYKNLKAKDLELTIRLKEAQLYLVENGKVPDGSTKALLARGIGAERRALGEAKIICDLCGQAFPYTETTLGIQKDLFIEHWTARHHGQELPREVIEELKALKWQAN